MSRNCNDRNSRHWEVMTIVKEVYQVESQALLSVTAAGVNYNIGETHVRLM